MGFFITTLMFLLASIIGIGLLRVFYNKGPETNLLHYTWVIMTTICCWLTWAIVYMAQMHPLVVPILKAEGE